MSTHGFLHLLREVLHAENQPYSRTLWKEKPDFFKKAFLVNPSSSVWPESVLSPPQRGLASFTEETH